MGGWPISKQTTEPFEKFFYHHENAVKPLFRLHTAQAIDFQAHPLWSWFSRLRLQCVTSARGTNAQVCMQMPGDSRGAPHFKQHFRAVLSITRVGVQGKELIMRTIEKVACERERENTWGKDELIPRHWAWFRLSVLRHASRGCESDKIKPQLFSWPEREYYAGEVAAGRR